MFTFASDILVCILAWLGLLLCRVRLVFAWWLCVRPGGSRAG
jgi:hypothetical protein